MKRSFVVLLSAILVLALSVVPAAASHTLLHVAAVAFAGTASTTALTAPVSTACGTPVGVCTPPATPTWSFTIGLLGVNGTGGHYQPPGATPIDLTQPRLGVSVNNVTGSVSGTLGPGPSLNPVLGPFCGASSGAGGEGSIAIPETTGVGPGTPPPTIFVDNAAWIQSVATIIVFTGDVTATLGGTKIGTIAGVVSAVPPNPVTTPGQSCVTSNPPNATTFTIVGAAVAQWQT